MELRIAFCIYFSKLLANSSEEESISDNASRKLLKTSSKDTWVNDSFRRSLISSVSSLHAIICSKYSRTSPSNFAQKVGASLCSVASCSAVKSNNPFILFPISSGFIPIELAKLFHSAHPSSFIPLRIRTPIE